MLKLSEEVHTFAFDILFGQLKGYLVNLANMEVGNNNSCIFTDSRVAYVIPWPLFVNPGFYIPKCSV